MIQFIISATIFYLLLLVVLTLVPLFRPPRHEEQEIERDILYSKKENYIRLGIFLIGVGLVVILWILEKTISNDTLLSAAFGPIMLLTFGIYLLYMANLFRTKGASESLNRWVRSTYWKENEPQMYRFFLNAYVVVGVITLLFALLFVIVRIIY